MIVILTGDPAALEGAAGGKPTSGLEQISNSLRLFEATIGKRSLFLFDFVVRYDHYNSGGRSKPSRSFPVCCHGFRRMSKHVHPTRGHFALPSIHCRTQHYLNALAAAPLFVPLVVACNLEKGSTPFCRHSTPGCDIYDLDMISSDCHDFTCRKFHQ